MKTLLAICLIAASGLAKAELSPEEFNDLGEVAIHYAGCYFSGTSHVNNVWFYRFNNKKGEPVAFVPMELENFEEAKAAFIASLGTLILCERQWKRPRKPSTRPSSAASRIH
jgi:hypothetical protein